MQALHIISFDNPYPPNYGGVVDVYFKIAALHAIGYEIHLHCFVSGDAIPSDELKSITKAVYFYKTSANPLLVLSSLPYSIASRNHADLEKNIARVDAPILFDGLKTAYLASRGHFRDRKRILRLHNIEQDYFAGIARSETSFLKKMLYSLESVKYRKFEPVLAKFDHVATLSRYEDAYVNAKFGNSVYVPVFHGNNAVKYFEGFGKYALYHGDLRTSDNIQSALFLASVFAKLPHRELVIASGTRNPEVDRQISGLPNIRFAPFETFDELQALFDDAHINISWSFQKSGTKLKLINALFNSRFSIINENITDDEILTELCILASDRADLAGEIENLMQIPFNDHRRRNDVLTTHMNDINNARLLKKMLQ